MTHTPTPARSTAAIATTPAGIRLLLPLCQAWKITLWIPPSLGPREAEAPDLKCYEGKLQDHLASLWRGTSGEVPPDLIFCLAAGAVTRLIAPLLRDKASDPAVVVVDPAGKFTISLCSGHQGGADRLTRQVAHHLSATPVITGAAEAAHLPGVDVLGLPFGWRRGTGDWTAVSAAIARRDPVAVKQTAGTALWRGGLPEEHPFQFEAAAAAAQVHITAAAVTPGVPAPQGKPAAYWHPRVLWLGVGCERGTSADVIAAGVDQALAQQGLSPLAVAGVASLDLKADEPGLLAFCRDRQWPLRCFDAQTLKQVSVPHPSDAVARAVGTPSVAEAAALQASRAAALRATKQVVRLAGEPGAATVAVAEAAQEETGREGQLWLVGTGPGALAQITPAARTAIATADVLIGYSLYVGLVRPLTRPGQIIEALPITQERQRAERAIALARRGLTVAVISSGDCGIYGMAGLVMETLEQQGWDGQRPGVQVFPGISALQAAAARVGAPLMHDFCAISLSDLLTPWETIEARLKAAAQADFVTALYNPKSKTRTQPIAVAQEIFLQHRAPDTPVALVRSAYRDDEQVQLTTLAQFLQYPVDMVTTVLIGNRCTRRLGNWLITPRGYMV
ncbi:MAG: precorrin-3B C(17)-methyltransferase [Elainellaceae cyanobacterium]